MASYLAVLALVAVCIPLSQQQVGTCPQSELDQLFTVTLADFGGPACGLGLLTFYFGPSANATDMELQDAVNTTCQQNCGGFYADYTFENCNDLFTPLSLISYCLPTGEEGAGQDRCRYFAPDNLDTSLIDNLEPCMSYDEEMPDTCPANCASALTSFANEVGCCYQNLYNDTTSLGVFVATDLLTADQAYFLGNITDPDLWSACSVDQEPSCEGDPFPGDRIFEFGVCTNEDYNTFLTEEVSERCSTSNNNLINPPDGFDDEDYVNAFSVVCTPECGGQIVNYVSETCRSPFSANYTLSVCHREPALPGAFQDIDALDRRCGLTIGAVSDPLLGAVGIFCANLDPEGACPVACVNALENLQEQLGCCYRTLYNNPNVVDFFVLQQAITLEQRAFFDYVAGLWEMCEVEQPLPCTGDPLSAGAVRFAASSVVVLVASVFMSLL